MSWGFDDIYDYDYEDTPEYMLRNVADEMIREEMVEENNKRLNNKGD